MALALSIVSGEAIAEGPHAEEYDEPAQALDLPAEVRAKLVLEMVAVQANTRRIVEGIALGRWADVAAAARQIDESYILKTELSEKEREVLHRALPAGFRRLDADFHRDAARLAEAADQRDGELVTFRFYKLLDGCVRCHASWARHRFEGHAPAAR